MFDPAPWQLRCRSCGLVDPVGEVQYCRACFGPLDLEVDWSATGAPGTVQDAISTGETTLWRYGALLPAHGVVRAGWTPLVPAPRLGETLGVRRLWLKDETRNPTGSFKDRLVALALARAMSSGAPVVATASTGNLARAVVAAATSAGIDAVVLVPAGEWHPWTAAGHGGDGPDVIELAVEGGYDAVNRLATEAAMRWESWAWVNVSLRPWYLEGAATLAYETAEQLGWRLPRHVVAPVASGGTLLRMHRAFHDLRDAGLAAGAPPAVSAAQPAGCAPMATAFARGAPDIVPLRPRDIETVAPSLAMGDPPDGPDLLAAVRSSGGAVVAVPEHEVAPATGLLAATESIDVEPAGGVAVAALERLVVDGVVDADDEVVLYLTGGPAPGMPRGSLGVRIEPSLEALSAALPEHLRDQP
jgi:threonine synthase